MLPRRAFAYLAVWIFLTLAAFSVAVPTAKAKEESDKSPPANKTTTDAVEVKPAHIDSVPDDGDIAKDKARECTLQAFKVIVSDDDVVLTPECQEILKALTRKNAHKEDRKVDGEADLRRELKELTKKEEVFNAMNREIQHDQLAAGEKHVVDAGNLKEINPERDDAALLEMEAEKKETNGEPPVARPPFIFEEQPSKPSSNFEAHLQDNLQSKLQSNEPGANSEFPAVNPNVGILGPSAGQHGIDEDFLVIPLRYLRQEFLLGPNVGRDSVQPSSGFGNAGREGGASIDDANADQWALQPMLDQPVREEETPKSKDDSPDVDTQPKRSDAKPLADGSNAFDVGGDESPDGMLPAEEIERPFSPKEQQDDMEVLALVEDDISKLGEDLRRLKFSNGD